MFTADHPLDVVPFLGLLAESSVLSLGALVSRAWPTTSPRHRWGDGRG